MVSFVSHAFVASIILKTKDKEETKRFDSTLEIWRLDGQRDHVVSSHNCPRNKSLQHVASVDEMCLNFGTRSHL